MADKLRSPGVFIEEVDQSFLEQDPEEIGAVVVGRTPKGPAFSPTTVKSFNEFVERFGNLEPTMQSTYAARNYLKNAGSLTVVRVLGDNGINTDATVGYSVGGITGITNSTGALGSNVLAEIHHSGTASVISVAGVATDADKFVFSIGSFAATCSFLTSSAQYIEKVLNTDPTRYSTDNHYLYRVFKHVPAAVSSSWHAVAVSGTLTAFTKSFSSGSTPWMISQVLGGNEYDLIRIHSVGHGKATNDEIKVSIQNIKPSQNPNLNPYGSFDIVVRDFYDSDLNQKVFESFIGCTLDPNDRNYVARRVGDSYLEYDSNGEKLTEIGEYSSQSKYIRVEVNKNNGAPQEALPWGYRGFKKLKWNAADTDTLGVAHDTPPLLLQPDQLDVNGNHNTNIHWGVSFVSGGINDFMKSLPALSDAQTTNNSVLDPDFSLKRLSGTYVQGNQRYSYTQSGSDYEPIFLSGAIQKFTVPLQNGFDGFDLRVKDPLDIAYTNGTTDLGVISIQKAINGVSNPDVVDFDRIAIPGVTNQSVTDFALSLVQNRKDCFYAMDLTGGTAAEVIDRLNTRNIDNNYAAVYYPDVKVDDPINNQIVRVSPSTVMLGAFAFSDRVGQKWFAPAGLNRGGLSQFDVVSVTDKLTFQEKDDLDESRINAISAFPAQGIAAFGQKTLQLAESALDRINVRMLLIFAKRTISRIAKKIVFEPNNPATWQRFTREVNPVLRAVQRDQGLARFLVVMDENLNTPDVVDRNRAIGKIFLQPIRTAEKIELSFVITRSGVEFSG